MRTMRFLWCVGVASVVGCAPSEDEESYADEVSETLEQGVAGTGPCGLQLQWTSDATPFLGSGTVENQEPTSTAVADVTTKFRTGTKGIRSVLSYDDPEVFGGPRAETAVVGAGGQSRYKAGDTVYYGFSVYIAPGWVNDSDKTDIIFQLHSAADPGEASHSPNMFVAVKRDELVLRVTSDSNAISTATSPVPQQFTITKLNLTTGGWHDIIMQVRWAHSGTSGVTKVWQKLSTASAYALKVNQTGPNMHNDSTAGFVKWGIYKPDWRNGPTLVSSRTVFHDNIRVGPTYNSVNPANATCVP